LHHKLKLSDLEINLSLLRGVLPDKDREKGNLSEGAIGGIWWLSDDNFVHGWFYLPAEDYDAIWEQIKQGDCQITLGTVMESVAFTGGEFAWKGNPICVESVEVTFKRKAIKVEMKEDSKAKIDWNKAWQQSLVGHIADFNRGDVLTAMEWIFRRLEEPYSRRS